MIYRILFLGLLLSACTAGGQQSEKFTFQGTIPMEGSLVYKD